MIAWFVFVARQDHDITVASDIVSQSAPVTASQAAQASSLLSAAGTLNPDQQVNVLQAALADARNDVPRAQRILESVGSAEPQNIQTWYLLAQISGSDAKPEALALRQIAILDPKVPSPP
jgi:predicted Zn-dependent protease